MSKDCNVRLSRNGRDSVLLITEGPGSLQVKIQLSNEELLQLVLDGATIARERLERGIFDIDQATQKLRGKNEG